MGSAPPEAADASVGDALETVADFVGVWAEGGGSCPRCQLCIGDGDTSGGSSVCCLDVVIGLLSPRSGRHNMVSGGGSRAFLKRGTLDGLIVC